MRKLLALCALLAIFVIATNAQTTSRLEGTVTDAQGAAVPGVEITVVNVDTNQTFTAQTDERGYWVLPSMPSATYKATVKKQGFKTATLENVKIDVGVPATANVTLEVGALTETVEVTAGAEVLQTSTATVTSTLVGRQLHELPFTSRNLTELIVTQPGSATPGVPRSTSVYGLPQGALNATLDGINIQDNINKSSDGFFNAIFPRADAIEEMTISSAAGEAQSNGEGAVQMRLVTRSGSNSFHGSLFEHHRNEFFNANYYYNNLTGQPRDHLVFNQFGGMVGGPIKKNKLFFFAYMEWFRLPQTYTEPVGTVLTPEARQGIFRYAVGGQVRTVNLFDIARAGGFPSTPDPILATTLGQIASLTESGSYLQSRIASNGDYNRNNLNFQSKGGNYRRFPQARIDWNISQKHHFEFTYNYQTNLRAPDGVNVGTASPAYPNTGVVLNGAAPGSQGGIAFLGVGAVRSTLTPRLTSEVRFGLTGGTVIFNDGVSPADFTQWRGYAPTFNFIQSPWRTTGQTRRNTPLKQGAANLTYTKDAHLVNFGFQYTQVNTWSSGITNSQFTPGISFALAANDPINTGSTNIFTTTNFPSATATNLSDAGALYALLTGRVSSITKNVILDDETRTYGAFQPIVKNRQREFGFYAQDSWRMRQGLTLTYGLRWTRQGAPVNLNGVYTRPGYAGLWGVSGVGNLFAPSVLSGSAPLYGAVEAGTPAYNTPNAFAPNLGIAWVVPKTDSRPLTWLLGRSGSTVIRAGYAISTIREDAGRLDAVWGANQGRTLSVGVDPAATPANFGAPGSVLFRDATLPSRTVASTPAYPIAVNANTNSVRDFDPNLKPGYVQSWDFSIQRELTRSTVLEVRYVGNHGTKLWRQIGLNEVNIFENGFLNEFRTAQSNLAIARASNPNSTQFAGLAGQQPLPIIQTALALNTDTTTATQIAQGQAGALASAIATNATRMGRLTAAGRPANFFQVNPAVSSGGSFLYMNGGDTNYNGLQVEVRRRFSAGLLFQGSYVWSHSISNEFSNGIAGNFQTLRNYDLDKGPSPYDVRHAVKMNWVYELPFGPRRQFLSGVSNIVAKKLLEGWQLASVARIQSGTPLLFTSGRATFNGGDSGVELGNITREQLQSMVDIRKTTNAQGVGVVYWLPQSIIDNSLAAFELGGKTLANLDRSQPYVGPASSPGALGTRLFLYGPMQQKWDFSLAKKTKIGERADVEFRVQALNAFNLTNFLLFAPGSNITTTSAIGTAFGQIPTNGAYRDLSNTNDPGGRVIEFGLRINF